MAVILFYVHEGIAFMFAAFHAAYGHTGKQPLISHPLLYILKHMFCELGTAGARQHPEIAQSLIL